MEKNMDNELDKLAGSKAPSPDTAARARALAAAMSAYDEAQKKSDAPQGNENSRRQSSILNELWSAVMNKKLLAGSALATLLIAPAAGYIALDMLRLHGKPGGFEAADVGKVPSESATLADSTSQKPIVVAKEEKKQGSAGDAANNTDEGIKNSETSFSANVKTRPEPAPAIKDEDETYHRAKGKFFEPAEQPKVEIEDLVTSPPLTNTQTESAGAVASAPAQGGGNGASGSLRAKVSGFVAPDSENGSSLARANEGGGGIMITPDGLFQLDENGQPIAQQTPSNNDRFTSKEINPVKQVATDPVSTFAIDVDTASYSYSRQALMAGQLPTPESVRVEEMINYFPYDWQGPKDAKEPFKTNVTVMRTPWNKDTKLMHVAIKGYDINAMQEKPSNLVFLIDVSGSMNEPNKLPLLKSAFRLLVNTLRPADSVSIVVYAGNSGVVLKPTKVSEKRKILDAIDNLEAGGGTAGAEGINAAYKMAEEGFVKDGVNRIFLATDGDFNVGASSDDELKKIIEDKRKSGIFLSVLGFGTGNYNDSLMQTLAQNGNGIAAYIDTLSEAQKTLVQEAKASIFPIAKDVKIQVEFNPAQVAEYRLIGYETRVLKREDFNNDRVDAGDIGSGHSVTAIYEITPKGSPAVQVDDLRYGKKSPVVSDEDGSSGAGSSELAFVKIRYKRPDEDKSNLITMPVGEDEEGGALASINPDVQFSVAVAAFGQKLKHEQQLDGYSWDHIRGLAVAGKGVDPFGYRAEFIKLIDLAKGLDRN